MISDLICKNGSSLLGVMRSINNNHMGACFIVNKIGVLKGVVTDGDIRRSLLNNSSLDSKVEHILSKEFVYGHIDEDYYSLMQKISNKISIIPLVDDSFKVIDFFEYKQKQYFPISNPILNGNELNYLTDAFLSTWISGSGTYINKFEEKFSSYSDCNYGISTSSGTSALHLALLSLGVGEGDEVIVPDLTFAATINAVLHSNATPVIVDIEEDSWCIDPREIKKAITSKTKAVIPVHLYGQPCDMEKIMELANKHNLKVIEDCAEAHGAMYKGQKVGSFGDVGCFSFYGNKVITTGEGGMCVTNNDKIFDKIKILRSHGMSETKKYWHDVVGYNYRMTNLQAAIGLAQLEKISLIHENRKKCEDYYKRVTLFKDFFFQKDIKNRKKITWLVGLLTPVSTDRDRLVEKLKDVNIDARLFFYPLSDMKIYKKYCKSFTAIAHKISKSGLNLPTYSDLKKIDKINSVIKNV